MSVVNSVNCKQQEVQKIVNTKKKAYNNTTHQQHIFHGSTMRVRAKTMDYSSWVGGCALSAYRGSWRMYVVPVIAKHNAMALYV